MDLTIIVLEMQERIIKLEKEIAGLKLEIDNFRSHEIDHNAIIEDNGGISKSIDKDGNTNTRKRDKTRYLYNGIVYLKNKLVYAVVKDYVNNHKDISKHELEKIFPRELQGSIGVIVDIKNARNRNDYNIRFFTKEEDVIHLVDDDVVVCSQWGIINIPKFVDKAKELGYKIETI